MTDSIELIRADIRYARKHFGKLRQWPLIRSHFWRRLVELRGGTIA